MAEETYGHNIICCRWLKRQVEDLQRGYACAIETHAVNNSIATKNSNSSGEVVCNRWLRVQLEFVMQGYRSAMSTNAENECLEEAIEKVETENEQLKEQINLLQSDGATREEYLKKRIAELENLVKVVTAST